MRIVVEKAKRALTLWDGDTVRLHCRIALGREPLGHKAREGDGRTPEGKYRICLIKAQGRYGRSLGLSYPSVVDARRAFAAGVISGEAFQCILAAHAQALRPPWGTPLGGEIYLHEGGAASDWTAGCIALEPEDMDALFPCRQAIDEVIILP